MECVIANNGNRSNLHKQLLAYNRLANFDVTTQDNIAVKAWLNATNGKLISQYPNMPLDINNEPMLFFHKKPLVTQTETDYIKPGVEELFDSNPELANRVYEALGFNGTKNLDVRNSIVKAYKDKTTIELPLTLLESLTEFDRAANPNRIVPAQLGEKDKLNPFDNIKEMTSRENIDRIKESITKNGFNGYLEISLNSKGALALTEGNHRLQALKELGYTNVPVKVLGRNTVEGEYFQMVENGKTRQYGLNLNKDFNNQITSQQKQQALQLYSQYLDTIFPNSVVKDIVYHGTDASNITEFRVSDGVHGEGIYFQTKHGPYHTGTFGKNTYSAIINSSNPFTFYKSYAGYDRELSEKWIEMRTAYEASGNLRNLAEDFNTYIKSLGHDSLKVQVGVKAIEEEFYYIMFNPKQIHILGSEKDVQGFQQFVNNSQTNFNNAEYNVTTDLDVVAQNPEAWQPSFLKEMPSFESTQETIPNDLQDLDSNNIDVKVGNLIYTDQGQLLGNVPNDVVIPAIPNMPNVQYQRRVTNATSLQELKTFASFLNAKMGIKFAIVTESEAKQMNSRYNGEPGFFMNNQAFLVLGKADKSTALHEIFGHPLLELLETHNPELLNKLYSEITSDIIEEIKILYPEYVVDNELSVLGLKEALIKSIENEAIGKLNEPSKSTLRNLIDMAWMFIKRLFNMHGDISNLSRYTTIKDIVSLAFDTTTLNPNYAENSEIMFRRNMGNASQMLSDMHTSFDKYEMQMVDGLDTYLNKVNSKIKLERATEVINQAFSNEVYGKTPKERAILMATRRFNSNLYVFKDSNDRSIKTGELKYTDDQFYTFDALVDKIEVDINTSMRNGKYVHTLMEYFTNTDPDLIPDLLKRLEEYNHPVMVNGKLFANPAETYRYKFILEMGLNEENDLADEIQYDIVRKTILDLLDMRIGTGANDDTILNEFIIANDDLGIGTTLDSLVIRPDGAMRLIDYKTGKLKSDDSYSRTLMKYMDVESKSAPIVKKRSIYAMALVMRAFIIKSAIPHARFENITLYEIDQYNSREGIHQDETDLPIQDYLNGIKQWIKETKPEVYEKFENQGLFDLNNYMTEGYNFRKALVGNPTATADSIREELISIVGQIQIMENANWSKSAIAQIEQQRETLLKAYIDTISLTKNTNGVFEDIDPLSGSILQYFKNRYDFSNVPVMQILIDEESNAITKAMKKFNDIKLQHDVLIDAVISDYERIDPGIRTKMRLSLGNSKMAGYSMYKGDGTGFFDFAYVEHDVQGVISLGWITEKHPKWDKLTKAQKEYMQFIVKEMRSSYKAGAEDIMLKDPKGVKVSKAKMINMPTLSENFMPFVPPTKDERNNRLSSVWEKLKLVKNDIALIKLTDSLNGVKGKPHPGMPVRFLTASEEIIENKVHSVHVEHMFLSFVKQMYLNKELEEVLAMGKGLEGYMQTLGKDENNEYTHKVIINALNTFIKMNISNRSKVGNDDIKVGKFVKDGKELQSINITYGINQFKNFTTYGSMAANPVLAGANLAMIASLNLKTAAVNSTMIALQKTLGIDTDDIDFRVSDLMWAQNQWREIQTLVMSQNKKGLENHKLYRMLKEWNILPDDYWFEGASNKEYSVTGSKLNAASSMFLHMLGENYGVITSFGAVVRKLEVKKGNLKKSVYDAYDIKEETTDNNIKIKRLTWNFGVRGVVAPKGSATSVNPNVRKITELSSHEIDNIKRVISRIHGDYRKNERTLGENYALGQWFGQFKKYMYRQLSNMFESKQIDSALGSYKDMVDPVTKAPLVLTYTNENGVEEKETYIEWVGRITEGRYITAINRLFYYLKFSNINLFKKVYASMGLEVPNLDTYSYDKLSTDQKKNLMHVGFDVVILLLGIMLKEGLFDDDDQNNKNPYYVRFGRYLEDMTEGMNFLATARSLKNPIPMTTRFYNLSTYGSDFILSVLTGDRTLNGDFRGYNSLLNNVPFANGYRKLKQMTDYE
jgi:hypothetical protein